MKKTFLGLLAITFSVCQPLMASSSLDGGEKQRKTEVSHPGQPSMGEMAQPNGAEATLTAEATLVEDAPSASTTSTKDQTESAVTQESSDDLAIIGTRKNIEVNHTKIDRILQKHVAKKAKMKPVREDRKHAGGAVIGILALTFGILGFLVGWLLWPIGLLFGVTAIVLGAIGIGVGSGRAMSIVGLILGILTILIPVLIIGLIVAVLLA